MQPYPRSPDLVWPGHLHGTGCLSARAMDTGFPTVVWRLCLGPGCAWIWVSVTPPALAGVLGGCVWVRFVVLPLFSPLGIAVFAVGVGSRPAPHLSWLGVWDVRGCVRAPPAPRRSRFWCSVWACVLGSGFRLHPPLLGEVLGFVCACVPVPRGLLHLLVEGVVRGCMVRLGLLPRPANPGWGVGACERLCALPACTPPFLAGVCCVGVCAGLCFGCAPPLFIGLFGCVCGRACAPPAPALPGGPPVARGCACVAVAGVCPPPSPFWFLLGGEALWCRSLVAPVLGLVVSVPPSLLLRAACFFFFRSSVVCVCVFLVSLLLVGRCPRLCVAGFGWMVPWCPFWGSCLQCRLGGGFGRLLWCWWAVWWLWAVLVPTRPLVFLFWGGSAYSSLCPPWAGARTGRHSVWSSGLLLVFAFYQAVPRPHGSDVVCTRWDRRPFLPGWVLALPAGRLRQAASCGLGLAVSFCLRGAGFNFLAAVCVGEPPLLLPGVRWPHAGV